MLKPVKLAYNPLRQPHPPLESTWPVRQQKK